MSFIRTLALLAVVAGCGRTALYDEPLAPSGSGGTGGRSQGGAPGTGGQAAGGGEAGGGAMGGEGGSVLTDGGVRPGRDAAGPFFDGGPPDLLPGGMVVVLPAAATVPVGQPVQFNAYVMRGGQTQDVTQAAQWSVDDTTVATIGSGMQAGVLTARRGGGTIVRASVAGMSGSTSVTTAEPRLMTIALSPTAGTVNTGGRLTFTATGMFSDGMARNIGAWAQWRTLDPAIARASNLPGERGAVTGVSVGATMVIASYAGVDSVPARISVLPPPRLVMVTITPSDQMRFVGQMLNYAATGQFSDGSRTDVTAQVAWSSSMPAIVAMTANAARCVGSGMSTITATPMGAPAATTSLRCVPMTATVVRITPSPLMLRVGTRQALTATATFADGTMATVTTQCQWASSNANVATVDSGTGVVTAVAAGSASVFATCPGAMNQAPPVTVTVTP